MSEANNFIVMIRIHYCIMVFYHSETIVLHNKCNNKDVVVLNQNHDITKIQFSIFSLVSIESRISINPISC